MIHITSDGIVSIARLREELDWLISEHPEKTELIGLAWDHLETFRRACSIESLSVTANPFILIPKQPKGNL